MFFTIWSLYIGLDWHIMNELLLKIRLPIERKANEYDLLSSCGLHSIIDMLVDLGFKLEC